MKACTKCGVVKAFTDFYRKKSGSVDGRMSSCKSCKTAALYAWRAKNGDKWREYVREEIKRPHRASKRAAYLQSDQARQLRLKHERNPKTKAKRKAYLIANPDRASVYNAKRGARRRAITKVGTVLPADWLAIKTRHGGRCIYCGKKPDRLTMDHFVPLAKGGAHDPSNIVPACRSCNSRKRDLAPQEFALAKGRLCW